MIRKAHEREFLEKERAFGGEGIVRAHLLLSGDEEFYGNGRLFNHVILEPGASIGVHKHVGEGEVYYILKGEGIYHDNGTPMPVDAGDVAICKNGESHGLENTSVDDLEMIALILYDNNN